MTRSSNNKKKLAGMLLFAALAFPMMASMLQGATSSTIEITGVGSSTMQSKFAWEPGYMDGLIFSPELALDSQGNAYFSYVDIALPSNDSTLKRRTTTTIVEHQGWKTMSWTSEGTIVAGISRHMLAGFLSTAVDANDVYHALFSNMTGLDMMDVMLYDSSSLSVVASMNYSWTAGANTSQPEVPRPASGKILFDATGKHHLMWNNGSAVFYKHQDTAFVMVDQAVGGIVGACDMILGSGNTPIITYSKATTSDPADKQLFITSGTFATKTQVTTGSVEDCQPSLALDADGKLHLAWASKVNDGTYLYVVKYKTGTTIANLAAATARELSTDLGGRTTGAQTRKIMAVLPKIMAIGGALHVFYCDSTNMNIGGSLQNSDLDMVWQYYANPSDMSNNVLTMLTVNDGDLEESFFSAVRSMHDDIFIANMAPHPTAVSPKVRLIKIDHTAPTVTFSGSFAAQLNAGSASIDQVTNITISFTPSEIDLSLLQISWDAILLTGITTATRSFTITDVNKLALGEHTLAITLRDEIGNQATVTVKITFLGLNVELVMAFLLIGAIGAGVVLLVLFLQKNKVKLAKRKLEKFSVGGDKSKTDTWDDEAPVEDDKGSGQLDDDTKIDLKKVDF